MSPSLPSPKVPKISPCLWYNNTALEASQFYTNLFNTSPHSSLHPPSKILNKTFYPPDSPRPCTDTDTNPSGSVLDVSFSLAGQEFRGLNGGDMFKFNCAVSLVVECEDQSEVDHFWEGFKEGVEGREMPCGWIADRWGLCWQVVPRVFRDLIENEPNQDKYNRLHMWMMKAMPKKLIVQDLIDAAEGRLAPPESENKLDGETDNLRQGACTVDG